MCIAHTAAPVSAGHADHVRIALQRGHIVDDFGPGLDGRPSHFGLGRVDGNGHWPARSQGLDHRQDAPQFFRGVDRLAVRLGTFTADVQNIGPEFGQLDGFLDGCRRIVELPAVGKTVGRNVQNSHQQRPSGQFERARAQPPDLGAVGKTLQAGVGHDG